MEVVIDVAEYVGLEFGFLHWGSNFTDSSLIAAILDGILEDGGKAAVTGGLLW